MNRIIVLLAALAIAAPVAAQQGTVSSDRVANLNPQRPTDDEINARIQTLTAQRNAAQDQVVMLSGQATAEIAKLRAELDALKAMDCKPKPKEKPKK